MKERTQERVPLDWATTQNNLGVVLKTLGEQTGDIQVLNQAKTVFEAALKERTQERVPVAWAQTQNNLRLTLAKLAEQLDLTDRQQAKMLYEQAADICEALSAAPKLISQMYPNQADKAIQEFVQLCAKYRTKADTLAQITCD